MPEPRRRVHAFVSGRVQGVMYRVSAWARARQLGVDGWVRNLDDGRVEIVAEGAPERVAEFLEWCREGPPDARVSAVDAADEEPASEPSGFRKT